MTGAIVFDSIGGQNINKGTFDSSRGGYNGISLTCAVGYELNWQAGWLTSSYDNAGTPVPLPINVDGGFGTSLKVWDSATDTGVQISHQHIVFPDNTYQATAWVDAPSDGSEYVRKDGDWSVSSGGGGGGSTISDISNAAATTLDNTPNANYQTLIYTNSGTLAWSAYAGVASVTNGYATSVNTPLDGQYPMYYSNQIIWTTLSFATESFVTSQGYATESFVTSQGYITSVPKPSVTTRTSSTHTATLADADNAIVFTASGVDLNIPQNYVVAFPIGTRIYVCNTHSTGHVSIVGLTDSTETTTIYGNLNATDGFHTLLKTDTNEWFISV